MKYIVLILFINLAYSQKNNGFIAKYNVVSSASKNDTINNFEKHRNLALNNVKSLKFNLLYNNHKSHFFVSPILESDLENKKFDFAKVFSGYTGDIYLDFENNVKYKSYNNNLGAYTTKTEIDNYVWEISSNESKFINKFLCLKATTKEKIINNYGTFYNEIVAWFAPEVAVSNGPLGFNGLPGLIFELHRKDVVFGLLSIQINPKEPVKIEFPDKKTLKTEEEVLKMKENFLLED